MNWDILRPIIKEKLMAVPGIGKVEDYIRNTTFWADYFKRNVVAQKAHMWEFTRISLPSEFDDVQGRQVAAMIYRDKHNVEVVGRMAVEDGSGSEHLFQAVVDGVADMLKSGTLMNGAVLIPEPAQVTFIGHRTYGGVLCHEARILFLATVRNRATGAG